MGIKRYFVFIEYLHFGKKSKEEGCFWKKVAFTSLVARHTKYTKNFFKLKKGWRKMVKKKTHLNKIHGYRERTRRWWNFQKKSTNNIIPSMKNSYIKNYKKIMKNLTKLDIKKYKLIVKIKKKNKVLKKSKFFLKSRSNLLVTLLIFSRKRSLRLKKLLNKVIIKEYHKLFKFIKKKIFFKKNKKKNIKSKFFLKNSILSKFLKKKMSSSFFIKKSLSLQNKISTILGHNLLGTNIYNISKIIKARVYSKSDKIGNRKYTTFYKRFFRNINILNKNQLDKKVLDALLEEFRFDPIYIKDKYSVAGGPRKRLSRNLRRAFKGKFIKNITNLIWFWEKVSRLVTYYVHSYLLIKKNII